MSADPDLPQDPGIPGTKVPEELPPQDEPEVERVPESEQPDFDGGGPMQPDEPNELEALSTRFMEAVRDRELDWLEAHLGREFTLTTGRPGAPVRGRAEWLAVTAERYVIEEFAFEELETLDLGGVGVVRSRYRQRGTMDGEDRTQAFLMTDVWVQRDGRAQLVTRHVSPLADTL
jgi:hypothetical protein